MLTCGNISPYLTSAVSNKKDLAMAQGMMQGMMQRMTRGIPGLCATLFFAISITDAHAALVSVDDPVFGVDSITRDTATGLEWLDVSLTLNRTWNGAESEFATYGFRHATQIEVGELVANAGIPGIDTGSSAANYAPITAFQDLVSCLAAYYEPTGQDDCTTKGWASTEIAGRAELSWAQRNNATGTAYVIVNSNNKIDGSSLDTYKHPTVGHWMVRTTVVPIPAAAWLFISALGALGLLQRVGPLSDEWLVRRT